MKKILSPIKIAILLFFTTALALVPGLKNFGVTWDEPRSYFQGVFRIMEWLKDPLNLSAYWPLLNEEAAQRITIYGHPPVIRYAGTLTWNLFHRWMGDISSMRMAAVFFFSGTISLAYYWVAKNEKSVAGWGAALLFFTMPRVLAHAFILSPEIALVFFWLCTSVIYFEWRHRKAAGIITGISFGFLIITKFTGLFWVAPIAIYELMAMRKVRFDFWIPLGVMGFAVAILFNPTWWLHPVDGIWNHHIRISLGRFDYLPITTFYAGRIGLPPWHYVPVLILATTPVITHLLLGFGVYSVFHPRKLDSFKTFCLTQFLTMLVLFSNPSSPKYDGVRLFLVIFIWLAILGGIGLSWVFEKWPRAHLASASIFFGLILGWQALRTHPFELSYFNFLVGGTKGAQNRGFESSYFWEAANKEFCDRLNQALPVDAVVQVYPPNPDHFSFLQFAGFLRKDIQFKVDPSRYLLLLTRQGQFTPPMWEIYKHQIPLVNNSFEGVSLIQLYDLQQK